MDYTKIVQRYSDKGDKKKAKFVTMYYIDHCTQKQIMDELYINNRFIYYRLRKSVSRDIISWHYMDTINYDELVKDYHKAKNIKKAYFVQYTYVFKWSREKVIKDLYLGGDSEYYRIKESIVNDIAKKKGHLSKEYNKNVS